MMSILSNYLKIIYTIEMSFIWDMLIHIMMVSDKNTYSLHILFFIYSNTNLFNKMINKIFKSIIKYKYNKISHGNASMEIFILCYL